MVTLEPLSLGSQRPAFDVWQTTTDPASDAWTEETRQSPEQPAKAVPFAHRTMKAKQEVSPMQARSILQAGIGSAQSPWTDAGEPISARRSSEGRALRESEADPPKPSTDVSDPRANADEASSEAEALQNPSQHSQGVSARYASTGRGDDDPSNRHCFVCGGPATPPCQDGQPTMQEECDNFNDLKDTCNTQGCFWRGNSSDDRTRSRNLVALGVFIVIVVLIVIGIFVLRWLPARSISSLQREVPACGAPQLVEIKM
jgi:hypothetical protein